MLIEQPPGFFRTLFPGALFREEGGGKRVFLTFDDGPIPEVTPWVVGILKERGIKATFFMVGDNARKYPDVLELVREEGHCIGNHTMHHLQGLRTGCRNFIEDIEAADALLHSPYFRPPHGWLRPRQAQLLRDKYRIVMYDLVTRDYSPRLSAGDVVANVKRYIREGSVIVFHDSLKSIDRLQKALPESLDWIISEGYSFATIEEAFLKSESKKKEKE